MNSDRKNPVSLRLCASVLKGRLPSLASAVSCRAFRAAALSAALSPFAAPSLPAENLWRYYKPAEEGNPTNVACVVQGDWIISVRTDAGRIDFYPDKGTLTLDQSLAGEGVLDLRDLSVAYSASDGSEATVKIGGLSFDVGYPWQNFQTCKATEIYANNLLRLPEFQGCKTLRKAWLSGDQVTTMAQSYRGFKECSSLTNIVIDCPNLLNIIGGFLEGTSITNDISEVCPPSVADIGQGAFGGYITGSLVLTNCMGGLSSIAGLAVTNYYLAGPYSGYGSSRDKGGTNGNGILTEQIFRGKDTKVSLTFKWPNVRDINENNYASVTKLREITIDMPAITNVNGGTFAGAVDLERLTVLGAAVPTNVVDSLLTGMPAFAPDEATVTREVWKATGFGGTSWRETQTRGRGILYCSRKQGWKALAKPLTPGTYEKEHAPAGCFGIWETAKGQRKAWMVHLPQDTDPKTGMMFVIR